MKFSLGIEEYILNKVIDDLCCSQYLAFYDFSSLCLHSRPRRQELLALSQPGGHPRVWMSVSRLALHVIREMTLKVQEANRFIMSRVASQSNGSPVGKLQRIWKFHPFFRLETFLQFWHFLNICCLLFIAVTASAYLLSFY